MAKHIGIRTLAEGVETEEQYAFLRDIGCEEVQGFYFSKPVLEGDVERMLWSTPDTDLRLAC